MENLPIDKPAASAPKWVKSMILDVVRKHVLSAEELEMDDPRNWKLHKGLEEFIISTYPVIPACRGEWDGYNRVDIYYSQKDPVEILFDWLNNFRIDKDGSIYFVGVLAVRVNQGWYDDFDFADIDKAIDRLNSIAVAEESDVRQVRESVKFVRCVIDPDDLYAQLKHIVLVDDQSVISLINDLIKLKEAKEKEKARRAKMNLHDKLEKAREAAAKALVDIEKLESQVGDLQ